MSRPRKPREPAPVAPPAAAARPASGNGGELHQQAQAGHTVLTSNTGMPIADNQNSLRAGPRGPTLLEDFLLREKISHFDHERIPERIVHARGSGAHGHFILSHSLKQYTTARVLTEVGKRTPVFCRFSTVAGGSGSSDTPRDVRGFAVKFYTSEGNWDLVGNNIPVFFIQDAIKFPDLVHAVKMEPDRGYPQAGSAHDNFWDFISLTPESMHMILWAMSDRTLPRSLRMMEGFGIHSFRLVDGNGKAVFVKFHWRPTLGLQSTLWDEAVKLAGADPDFHRRDLHEAIQEGQFPSWDLAVQVFTQEQANALPFDHLDATKLITEEQLPLRIIGRMVLDRWPDNFFAETEQVAFCPSHLVPGIDFSEDPLLQGRLFSYLDTQLSRLGSPNFQQLPINAPKCPMANLQRDGQMQMKVPGGRVNYEPSSLDAGSPRETPRGFRSAALEAEGSRSRLRAASFADHYSQPRQFYRSQSAFEQAHIVAALVFELSRVETAHVRVAIVGHLQHVDTDLALRVAAGLGMGEVPPAPAAASDPLDLPTSLALRLIGKTQDSLKGRCVGVLIADGSKAATLKALRAATGAAGARLRIVASTLGGAVLDDGTRQAADGQLAGTPSVVFDAIALVLSATAGAALAHESSALGFVRDAYAHLKAIAADDGARILLQAAGVHPADGVFDAEQVGAFVNAAKTRVWAREASLHPARTAPPGSSRVRGRAPASV